MESLLASGCPCLFGSGAARKLVDSGAGSDEGGEGTSSRSWMATAMTPISTFQQKMADDRARKQRVAMLQAGATMHLLAAKRSHTVRVQLSQDGAMLTWQSLQQEENQPTESGVMALAIIREIKPVLQGGLLSSGTPAPLRWQIVSDEETVKFEAQSEVEKESWMNALQDLSKQQADAKVQRKMGYMSKRKMSLEERRREAERRKAEVLKTCGCGGMKHTAQAMMNRS